MANILGIKTRPTTTRSSTELSAAAKKWSTAGAYKYNDLAPGLEGQIYDDGQQKYIYLADHYWPVTLNENSTATIAKVNKGNDVNIVMENDKWSLPPASYPAPPRASLIDSKLEQRVLETFPIETGRYFPASEAPTYASFMYIYELESLAFLYVGGRYRYLRRGNWDADNFIHAELYQTYDEFLKQVNPLKIKFYFPEKKWYLEDESAKSNVAVTPGVEMKTTATRSSVELSASAAKWSAGKAYEYNNMVPGREGQIYDDGQRKYIYLANHYWPVTLNENNTGIIEKVNKGDDVNIVMENNQWAPTESEKEKIFAALKKAFPLEYFYPAPDRETAIDPKLEKWVLDTVPVITGHSISEEKVKMVSPRYKYYRYYTRDLLYVGGRYHYINNIKENSDGSCTAELYFYSPLLDKGAESRKIIFKPEDNKWHLADETAVSGESTLIKSIVTTSTAELSEFAKTWPTDLAYEYENMAPGQEGQIYNNGVSNYIYLANHYWPVTLQENNIGSIPEVDEGYDARIILQNNQWSLVSLTLSQVTVVSPAVKAVLDSVVTGTGLSYRGKVEEIEGAIYTISGKNYLYLSEEFWPVELLENNQLDLKFRTITENTVTIRLNIKDGQLEFSISSGGGEVINQIATSSAVIEALQGADIKSKYSHPDVSVGLEGFVYKHGSNKYIYLNGHFYDFHWLIGNIGMVKITESGIEKVIFIREKNQQWELITKISAESYPAFEDTLRRIRTLNSESEIYKVLRPALYANDHISWQSILIDLHKVFEEEIFKRYTSPDDNVLKNLLLVRSRLTSWINQDETQIASSARDLTWDESLLALYSTALTQGTPNTGILAAAQTARAQIKDLQKKRDSLSTADVDKRIDAQNTILAGYQKQVDVMYTNLNYAGLTALGRERTEADAKLVEIKIKGVKEKIKILEEVRGNIIGKREEYDKQIKVLNDLYNIAFSGIKLGEDTLTKNIAEQGESKDEMIATESAITELALKEVVIVSKERTQYTSEESNEIQKINIAKSLLMHKQAQRLTFDEILSQLKDDDIDKPELKNNYSDIIWAGEQGKKIARKMFGDNGGAEVDDILTAICYWLLKNNYSVADLKKTNVDTVLDKYYADYHSLNRLTQDKEIPAGYTPLSGLQSSDYFESQSEYNEQFPHYKKTSAEYEASEITKDLLLSSPLTLEEMHQPIKNIFRLRITKGEDRNKSYPGELLFIELQDGRWIFFSLFPGKMFSKILTKEQVEKNDYMKKGILKMKTAERFYTSGLQDPFAGSWYGKTFPDQRAYIATYGATTVNWDRIKGALLKPLLYTGAQGAYDSLPYTEDKNDTHRMVFDYGDNPEDPGGINVFDALNKAMTAVLGYSADAQKAELYKPSMLQKIATFILPFYKEIYHATTDKEYKVDEVSIFLDALGVATTLAMAGAKVAAVIKNTKNIVQLTQKGFKSGLSGKSLRLFVAKEMAKKPDFKAISIAKITTSALIDIVDPFMLKNMGNFAAKGAQKLGQKLRNLNPKGIVSTVSQGINIKYKTTGITLDEKKKEVLHEGEVYYMEVAGSGIKKYYIKDSNNNVYEVRWDDAYSTWRTVDPNNPGKLSYGDAVQYVSGTWTLKGGTTLDKNMFQRFTPKEPLRDAARRSQLSQDTSGVCWDYAVDLIENAKMLSKENANALRKGIKLASKYQSGNPESPGGVSKIFESTKTITNDEALLRVNPGEVIIFMATDPNAPTKGARPIHAMVSIGNGRFAGMKNSVLHTSLSDEKKILTAEQLGEFKDDAFKLRGNDQHLTDLHIIAGEPIGILREAKPSLRDLAELTVAGDKVDTVDEAIRILKASGELDWRQANALGQELRALFRPAAGAVIATNHNVKNLFNNAVAITIRDGLNSVQKGQLVVFTESYSSFAIQHFMIGLGNGEFMMINPHLLDASLSGSKGVIKASQLPDEVFTKFRLISGDLSLGNLRMASLLGRESEFRVIGKELIVRMHGAPVMAHGMDAYELSEALKGLALRNNEDWSKIDKINFESCFGAFGAMSTGKALAFLTNKKVTAYPLVFNNMMRRNTGFFQRARVYLPKDVTPTELTKIRDQNSRNHDFWNRIYTPMLAVSGYRSPKDFSDVLENVKALASGKMTQAAFLESVPTFKSDLLISEKEFTELLNTAAVGREQTAQRCWDILMASAYTASLVDKELGGTGN